MESSSDYQLKDFTIQCFGPGVYDSPFLKNQQRRLVTDSSRIVFSVNAQELDRERMAGRSPLSLEEAGPRSKIFFNAEKTTAGIVTCGGLCPGLNDVIRTIVMELHWEYGVRNILGFRYGYEGMSSHRKEEPMVMTPWTVKSIQHDGGTMLGTSRGDQDVDDMVDTLVKFGIDMLFVIGGDGTFSGANELTQKIAQRGLTIAVVGIPKTIDNDIYFCEQTFGFSTAVEEGRKAILSAHNEAEAAWNGIGLVKLMGRDSGFIAMHSTLANSDVNFCLIPEVPFTLQGPGGLFVRLEDRLKRRHHAVIVAAEGAGQDLISGTLQTDASGNVLNKDVGLFLKENIRQYFQSKGIPVSLKYIDPSYMIRSTAADANDSAFCVLLGQNAVHAAMAGKTEMFVGYWNNHFTHVPFRMAAGRRKTVDPCANFWQSVVSMTD